MKTEFWPKAWEYILHHYWIVILSIGVFTVMLETIEHLPTVTDREPFYYGEVFLIGLMLWVTGFLIRMLVRTLAEKTEALNTLHVKNEISQQLAAGYDINTVSEQLVREISGLVPGVGVELYLYKHNQERLYQTAYINMDHPIDQAAALPPGNDPCRACFLEKSTARYSVSSCNRLLCPMFAGGRQDFCLQLSHGNWMLGVLHLVAPAGNALPDKKVKLLENVAFDISSALGMAVRKIEHDELSLAQKINTVQLEIARDLHDTIGQNISYLRMKLEHLADSRMKVDISPEIQHMSSVANESYDLVRGTLAMLQPNRSAHLHELFDGHARQIMDRSGLEISIDCRGEPRNISTRQMRQLFYIFREALNNVEKHAKASSVQVDINWLRQELSLTITDNGRGFDMDQEMAGGHYGLKFIRERVEQLNGNFAIWSSLGSGTRITVRYPYETEISPIPVTEPIHQN